LAARHEPRAQVARDRARPPRAGPPKVMGALRQ